MKGNLSNFELENIARRHKIKLDGVLSKDELIKPAMIHKLKYNRNWNLILNMQNLYADDGDLQGGTHWVSLIRNGDLYLYFDSYGFKPFNEVFILIQELTQRPKILYNEKQIQAPNTTLCGYYALLFIDYFRDNLRKTNNPVRIFNRFTSEFVKASKTNDNILKKLIKRYF